MKTIIKSLVIADELSLVSPFAIQSPLSEVNETGENEVSVEYLNGGELSPETQTDTVHAEDDHLIENQISDEGLIETVSTKMVEEASVNHLEELKEQALKESYEQGYSKGETEAILKYSSSLQLLDQLVDSANTTISDSLENMRDLIGFIVFEAVSKIVGEKLATLEGCNEVITKIITGIQRDRVLAIKVSPKDFVNLQAMQAINDNQSSKEFLGISVEPDESIELGGCIVKLRDGLIDGSIEAQFQTFAQSLKDHR